MPDSMVERVARATARVGYAGFHGIDLNAEMVAHTDHFKRWYQDRSANFREHARAAIEAMREPSGRMRAAGRDAIEPLLPDGRVAKPLRHQWQIADDTWQAMIDAALPEDAAHG